MRAIVSIVVLVVAVVPLGVRPAEAAAAPTCLGRPATHVMRVGDGGYYGTAGDDVVVGSVRNDNIQVSGSGGVDLVCGNAGRDFVTVSGEGSVADGGSGDDIVYVFEGATGRGGTGSDFVYVQYGGTADGGSGDDFVESYYGGVLLGGSGTDTLWNAAGDPLIDCGAGRRDGVFANGATDVRQCEKTITP